MASSVIEAGHTGRIVYARLRPNEDLVQTVEKLCLQYGFAAAIVRGSLGSLSQACLALSGGDLIDVAGPAVEILSLTGEVRPDVNGTPGAFLSGAVAGPAGLVQAGAFVSGRNPVCITFEITLEEWLTDPV